MKEKLIIKQKEIKLIRDLNIVEIKVKKGKILFQKNQYKVKINSIGDFEEEMNLLK
jgi:hypothetical protein